MNLIVATLVSLPTIATLWYIYSKWNTARTVKSFSDRNVKYVQYGSLIVDFLRRVRPERKRDVLLAREGKVFGFTQVGVKNIMVAEPELIQLIMSKEFTSFINRGKLLSSISLFKNMLLAAQDEQWKRLRAIVTPAFSMAKLRKMKCFIDDTAKTLMKNMDDVLEKSNIMNMKPLFSAFAKDTIIRIAFGIQVDSLIDPEHPITSSTNKIFAQSMNLRDIVSFVLSTLCPRVASALKMQMSDTSEMQYLRKVCMEIVRKKRDELQNGGNLEKGSNFIELMLEAEEAQNREVVKNMEQGGKLVKFISNDEIVAQCMLFFIVGFDTVATTLTLACHFLATNPKTQEKLYQEILDNFQKLSHEKSNNDSIDLNHINLGPELITFESLSRFEYLSAVINETLRIYPPALMTDRRAIKDIDLETSDGQHRIHVKKGDVVVIPIYSVHRDEQQFPDPERFHPERFLGEPSFHKYSYIPLGAGPRNCVAKSLALLEVKVALMNVIWRYKLSVCEETLIPVEFYHQFNILVPKDVNLKIEKRF